MENVNETSIGERIKSRRSELSLTLKELSKTSGLSPQLISDYENGRKEPGIKNLKILCTALKVYPNYFLCDDKWDVSKGKMNTYGNALRLYLEAMEISKKDDLIVDLEKKEVFIKINDEILKNAFTIIKKMGMDKEMLKETMENFTVSMLSSQEIE
ncbi:MAG: helix-turn-helix domain-containing protein [Bacilli bacterium]|nr:helix-turn-helix domain-containing protein [Bacilli bacterium]